MKNNKTQGIVLLFTALLGASLMLFVAGCASLDAPNQASLLSAAGFRTVVPQTPKQVEMYNAAESYKVLQGTAADGRTFYAYKDERKGVAYVGGPAQYQRYNQLAVEQRISRDYYMAARMNRDAAYGWYGAYGPSRFWW